MDHGRDPSEAARDVQCPVLILVCEQDNLVSPQSHLKAAQAVGDRACIKSYPIGHFDIYEGVWFEEALAQQITFIQDSAHPALQVIS